MKVPLGFTGIINFGQGVQITGIGCKADFGIAVQVGNAFDHREPSMDFLALAAAPTSNTELIGTIDDGLDNFLVDGLLTDWSVVGMSRNGILQI